MRRALSIAALALLVPLPVLADAQDAYMCRNGLFAGDDQTIVLMRAIGRPRTFFLWDRDTKGCPADIKVCRHSYVLPGQQVLAGKSANGFICAFYPNSVGGAAGWVVASQLALEPKQPDPDPPLAAWTGRWRDGDDKIDIKVSGGLLKASGHALWQGLGGFHFGGFEAKARPLRAGVTFVEYEEDPEAGCIVTAKLIGQYLIVADNMKCGGMNVRFHGVYRRAKKR